MARRPYMDRIALAATDAQVRMAAEHFSSIAFKPWIHQVAEGIVDIAAYVASIEPSGAGKRFRPRRRKME